MIKTYSGVFLLIVFIPLAVFSIEKDSLLLLLQTQDVKRHASLYNELASIEAEEENFFKSNEMAYKALHLAQMNDQLNEEFVAILNLGYNFHDLGKADSAVFYGRKGLAVAKKISNPVYIARAYNHLGNAYSGLPYYDKALSNYFSSLKLIEDTLPGLTWQEHQRYSALLLNNIGIVYSKLQQNDKALSYSLRSLSIRKDQNNLPGIASCLQNIGVIYEKEGKFDSTLSLYKQALHIRDSLNQESYSAELLMNIGIIYLKQGKYALSEENLLAAINIFKKVSKGKLLAHANIMLADLYLEMRKPEKAKSYIDEAITIARDNGNKVYERDGYHRLSEFYAMTGNYEMAFNNAQKEITLSDTIFSAEMSMKIAEIQTKYATDKMEREIEILSRDNEIQHLKIKRKSNQVIILVVVVIIIILTLLLLILLLNRRKLKQKHYKVELEKSELLKNRLQEENTYQSKQLTTHALNMLHKNKLLQEMDNELGAFTSKADEELKKKLNNIRRQIKRNMNSEKEWELFKLYFEEVNRDFFENLQSQCSDLTSGDIKLAALIKLNLNIKETAAVLNISPDSLRKARYRLRRKLGLVDRENLSDFLQKLS